MRAFSDGVPTSFALNDPKGSELLFRILATTGASRPSEVTRRIFVRLRRCPRNEQHSNRTVD
jgi:hypothetical protein